MASEQVEEKGLGKKKEVAMSDCPVHSVVVYPDRAEVTREVVVEMLVGDGEVVLKNLSKCLDKDSIRVDGIGPASITEVSYQEISVTEEEAKEDTSPEVAELTDRLTELSAAQEELQKRTERLDVQKSMMAQYSEGLVGSGAQAKSTDLTDAATIDGMFTFLETFEDRFIDLAVTSLEALEEKTKLQKEVEEVTSRLGQLKPKTQSSTSPPKQHVVGILLSVKEEGEIKLLVSYVVSHASWAPKYDLRVTSGERSMTVNYFGMVQQNTGEDWLDTRLSLSTAAPSIGGSAPKLETSHLTLIPNAFPDRGKSTGRKERKAWGFGEEAKTIEAAQAQVTEGLSSSVFEIAVLASVPSDNSGHKVNIGTVHLRPTFEYDTVPKLTQHAFLRAKVINNSSFPFLAGPANVFLDQSYVTETTLSSVSPNEEFSCSLGVDASVRVVYKPVRRFREEGGLISKNVTYTYKQVTELSNTRAEPALVTFTDQVPKSEDEKLKVTLVEPAIPKVKQGAPPPNPKLNSSNNVEWRLELKPGETRSVTIQYTVEFPANKKVEGL